MNEKINEPEWRINEWINEWMNECMNEWLHEWMQLNEEWMNE